MKIRWFSIIMSLLLVMTVFGCTEMELKQEDDENQGLNINVETPIIFSQNSVKLADGATVYVNIEMISGRYYFDEMAGAFQGANWSGQYQIHVYTNEFDFDSTKYLAPISLNDSQEMIFKDSFSLLFDDYNDDDNPDFVLGQYSSSNGFEYAIFSINQNGEVNRLDTSDGSMFIGMHDYSIQLEKLSPTAFKIEFYDNSIGGFVERVYKWEANKFIFDEITETSEENDYEASSDETKNNDISPIWNDVDFFIMTDYPNASLNGVTWGGGYERDKTCKMSISEMISSLDNTGNGFTFDLRTTQGLYLEFHFNPNITPAEIKNMYYINGNNETEHHDLESLKVPEEIGVYNFFVNLQWTDGSEEIVYFRAEVKESF